MLNNCQYSSKRISALVKYYSTNNPNNNNKKNKKNKYIYEKIHIAD